MKKILFSPNDTNKIINRYLGGEPTTSIGVSFGVSNHTIRKLLLGNNIQIRTKQILISRHREQDILSRYTRGESLKEIANRYCFSNSVIRRIIEKNGGEIRKRGSVTRKYSIDESCFSTLNENSLYWGGYLAADGSITGKFRTQITATSKDVDILEKLTLFIGSPNRPLHRYKNQEVYKLSFSSRRIANDLVKFGIIPNKAKRLKIPHSVHYNNIVASRDYWRGFCDGDGSLFYHTGGTPVVAFTSSSMTILEQFCAFLQHHNIKPPKIQKYIGTSGTTMYHIAMYSSNAIKLAEILYTNSNVYMDRKHTLAMEFLQLYG